MTKFENKSIARIATIQALYQYEINNKTDIVEELVQNILSFYKSEFSNEINIMPYVEYIRQMIELTLHNTEIIDRIIIDHLAEKSTWQSLSILLLSLLRVGVCEISYFPDTPRLVIVSEFTDIASDMLDTHEVGFVNSILDKISLKIRHITPDSLNEQMT